MGKRVAEGGFNEGQRSKGLLFRIEIKKVTTGDWGKKAWEDETGNERAKRRRGTPGVLDKRHE